MAESTNLGPTPAQRLRDMLKEPGKIIVGPGVYDGLSARIALQVGFDCLYMVSRDAQSTNRLCQQTC